jgi:hypothetical protein
VNGFYDADGNKLAIGEYKKDKSRQMVFFEWKQTK